MSEKSKSANDTRLELNLTRWQSNTWFKQNDGIERNYMEKPLDTHHYCTLRLAWVIDRYGQLTCEYAPVAYIDEKWFYKVNCRRAMKVLPKGRHKNDEEGEMKLLKMLSRRFPVKRMFMAVVGRPLPHRNFDGKIHLERLSKTCRISTRT